MVQFMPCSRRARGVIPDRCGLPPDDAPFLSGGGAAHHAGTTDSDPTTVFFAVDTGHALHLAAAAQVIDQTLVGAAVHALADPGRNAHTAGLPGGKGPIFSAEAGVGG